MLDYGAVGRPLESPEKVKFKAVDYANHRLYIAEPVFDSALIGALTKPTDSSKLLHLMRMSYYAVFIPENRLDKCMTPIADVLDAALLKQ